MKIEILQVAYLEFRAAQEFYELEQSGLGARFENEIRHALLRIQQYPKVWSAERKEIRRCFIHKFPYKIIYSIQKGRDPGCPRTAEINTCGTSGEDQADQGRCR